MSYDVIGKAETELTRMELISSIVQRSIREQGQLVPLVRDVSSLATVGLDTISFPRRTQSFAVQNLIEDSEADVQAITYDLDKLDLNQHAMVSWFIKKRANVQSMIDLESDALLEAAAEHAIDVDRKIIAKLLLEAASANNVAITGAWTTAKFLEVKSNLQKATKLRTNNSNFFMAVNSDKESQLLDLPRFVEADKYGSAMPLVNGELGRAYGMRIVLTDELASNKSIGWIQEGVIYGEQSGADFTEAVKPRKAGVEYALDMLYGVKVLDGGKYVSVVTHS